MPRVISVFLSTLSTDRVRRKAGDAAPPPEAPLILVGRDGPRRVVLAADAAAQAAGLRVGMPASKAQALVRGLVIQDADPTADAAALDRLALWMLAALCPNRRRRSAGRNRHRASARIICTEESRLARGPGRKARWSRLERSRRHCRYVGRGPHAPARFDARPSPMSEPGSAARDVEHLPIAALRLAPGLVHDLHVLGFERVGDCGAAARGPGAALRP